MRAVEADALAVLEARSRPATFAVIRVLFPDPWPKRRHVGRRLVDPGFVRLATDRLAVGGTLHLATDWDDYAQQMRASLATDARLVPVLDVVDPDPEPPPSGAGRPARGALAHHRPPRHRLRAPGPRRRPGHRRPGVRPPPVLDLRRRIGQASGVAVGLGLPAASWRGRASSSSASASTAGSMVGDGALTPGPPSARSQPTPGT